MFNEGKIKYFVWTKNLAWSLQLFLAVSCSNSSETISFCFPSDPLSTRNPRGATLVWNLVTLTLHTLPSFILVSGEYSKTFCYLPISAPPQTLPTYLYSFTSLVEILVLFLTWRPGKNSRVGCLWRSDSLSPNPIITATGSGWCLNPNSNQNLGTEL